MKKRNLIATAMLILAPGWLAGCGSGSNVSDGGNFSNFTGSSSQGAGQNQTPVVVGPSIRHKYFYANLALGGSVPNTTFRVEDLNGTVLATGVSNRHGELTLTDLNLPNDIRVVARVGASQIEFSRVMFNYGRKPFIARVNLLSTLVDAYHRTHAVDWVESERVVRNALMLPPTLNLMVGMEEPNPVFSDFAFLHAVVTAGGWEPFLQQFLSDAEAGHKRMFQLSLGDLITPFQGLDSDLNRGVEYTRHRLSVHLGYEGHTPERGTTRRISSHISPVLDETGGSVVGDFFFGVSQGITGNVIGGVTTTALGWAANEMGLNYGTGGQLNDIQNTLNSVLTELDALTSGAETAQVFAQLNALNNTCIPITTNTQSLASAANSTTVTNEPIPTSPTVADLVSAINQPNIATLLASVQSGMLGSSQAFLNSLHVQLTTNLGIDQPANMYRFPWRFNHIMDEVMPIYNYFANEQIQALNLGAEQAHNYFKFTDPVVGVANFLPVFRNAAKQLKFQRQQVPMANSTYALLTDFENGVMWHQEVHSPLSFDNAQDLPSQTQVQVTFPDGSSMTYEDFRLPTYGECLALQRRLTYDPVKQAGITRNSTSFPDPANSTPSLPSLGFWFPDEGSNNFSGSFDSDGSLWFMAWTNDQDFITNEVFQLNHASSQANPLSSNTPALLCRTFGNQSQSAIVTPYYLTSGLSPVPGPVKGRDLTPGEAALYGLPTSIQNLALQPASTAPITVSGTSYTLPQNSLQASANITFQVNLGGSWTAGASGASASFTNPTATQTQTASTKNSNGTPNALASWVAWDTDNFRVLEIFNVPYLDGVAIPRSSSTACNVTATILGQGGTAVTGSLTYTPTAVSPPTVQSLQIGPRNQIYGGSSTQPSTGSYPLFCTAFLADKTIQTYGSNVTWSVTPANNEAGVAVIQGGSGPILQMRQPSQPVPSPYNVTLTATYAGLTDSTTLQIVPPLGDGRPAIDSLVPGVGSASGGNSVSIRGQNIGSVTSVTVGGTVVPFVINTPTQLTIRSMPAGSSGDTVNIVIQNNFGSFTASYLYN